MEIKENPHRSPEKQFQTINISAKGTCIIILNKREKSNFLIFEK